MNYGSLARLAFTSLRCTLRCRVRGVKASFVTCEGYLPRIYGQGEVVLGRIALRGILLPIELGARHGGRLVIESGTFINQGTSIVADCDISIGENVRIGDFVSIYDSDHHPVDSASETRTRPVKIGNNVWLARGVIVLPGVTIGDDVVVAAGAVVTSDIPARTLAAGNPAEVKRQLEVSPGWRRM